MKKVNWVTNMCSEWRESRINPDVDYIYIDLDDVCTLAVDNLALALCRFMTEIRKLDGTEFLGKIMYEIILFIQFYLET